MQILPGRFQVCDGNPNNGLLSRSIYNQDGTIGDGTDAGARGGLEDIFKRLALIRIYGHDKPPS
jgi:hypothetical protein